MNRGLPGFLVAVNIGLAALLAWLWIGQDGKPRNVHWEPPRAIRPDFSGPLATLGRMRTDEVGQLVAMADRPLFSPTRRPPPPPPPPVPPPPPDALAGLQILGVYTGAHGAGVVARAEGRVRRAAVNERFGDWTLSGIEGRDVTFTRGTEKRVFPLAAARATPGAIQVKTAPAAPAAGTPPAAPTQMSGAQRAEEEERARLRYINEMNIRNGLPPVNQR